MSRRFLIVLLLAFSVAKLDIFAEPEPQLINEIIECPAEEVISELSSDNYIESLKSMGYYKNDYKDNDINLRNAVLRFQSDCNLIADGIQGPIFKSAMLKRMMAGSSFKSPDIIARAPSRSHWIAINRTKRTLTLYNRRTVIRKYPIALGRETAKTPEGKFYVYLKRKNPMWTGGRNAKAVMGGSPENPLGLRWIGLSLGEGNIYGIHGNNSPYSIGRSVSKGCIRMINSDVVSLYSMITSGTPVWIGNDETLIKWGVIQESYY